MFLGRKEKENQGTLVQLDSTAREENTDDYKSWILHTKTLQGYPTCLYLDAHLNPFPNLQEQKLLSVLNYKAGL